MRSNENAMKMGSISTWGESLEAFKAEIHTAEELGFGLIGVGDSPSGWRELYTSLTVAALETRTALLAPMVTIAVSRHPMVVASAMSTLYDLSGGRARFAIGTGGSATASMGMGALTQKQCRDHMLALRDLFAGRTTQWEGREVPAMRFPRPVPIYYSAKGPKALALAGEVADGVVLQIGMSNEETARKVKLVRDSAAAHGRDPMSIDIWAFSFTAVRHAREAALEDVKAFLAATGAYTMNQKGFLHTVPGQFAAKLSELQSRYDPAQHCVVGGANARLIDELGLTDYLAESVAMAGTSDEVAKVLRGLEDLGVSHLMCALPGNADPLGTMRRMKDAFDLSTQPATKASAPAGVA